MFKNFTIKMIISILTTISFLALAGCASFHAEQAPCDQYGTGCGNKIKINQW